MRHARTARGGPAGGVGGDAGPPRRGKPSHGDSGGPAALSLAPGAPAAGRGSGGPGPCTDPAGRFASLEGKVHRNGHAGAAPCGMTPCFKGKTSGQANTRTAARAPAAAGPWTQRAPPSSVDPQVCALERARPRSRAGAALP